MPCASFSEDDDLLDVVGCDVMALLAVFSSIILSYLTNIMVWYSIVWYRKPKRGGGFESL